MAGARGAARRQLVGRSVRRRNRQRREWTLPRVPWRAVATLLILAALPFAVRPVLRAVQDHPYFAIREVVIHHHGRLPEAELRDALGIRAGDASGTSIPRLRRRVCAPGSGSARRASGASSRTASWCGCASIARRRSWRSPTCGRASTTSRPTAASSRRSARPTAATCRTSPASPRPISTAAPASVRKAVHRALGLLRMVSRDAGGVGAVSEVHVDPDARAHAAAGAAGRSPSCSGGATSTDKLDRLGRVLPLWAERAAEVREMSCIFEDQVIVRLRAPLPGPAPAKSRGGGVKRCPGGINSWWGSTSVPSRSASSWPRCPDTGWRSSASAPRRRPA